MSETALELIVGINVPTTPTPVADAVHVILSLVVRVHVRLFAVPLRIISAAINVAGSIALENTTVKTTGTVFIGST